MKHHTQSPPAVIFVILFGLFMLLIFYNSNSRNEAFHYNAETANLPLPSDLRKWGVKSGYRPASGNKTLDRHCGQCVIITSSSHVLGSKLGPLIDQAECIIRMNDAPTTGYEADVGHRTTFRVVAHSSLFRVLRKPKEFVSKTPENILIFWGPEGRMKKSLFKVIQRASAAYPNMTAFVVSGNRLGQFDRLFKKETGKDRETSRSWLSTGWFTMLISIELCDTIHVYGMIPANYCSTQRPHSRKMAYHYYEPKGPDECVTYIHNEWSKRGYHHRFITEKRVFAKWASLYNITFSHPSWN
ncbi:alpha-N-acetylgalactosaminide alpha-2,6-sialyltransferase 6 isoform X1 [Anolis sagrei]|uniref:alpha-N-acetylgalactosaminide alpha-2,6-sialyltransferase 6 isoform X1 n=1 Tax=Anolis sagrei TaxID=38937 RepID=UPI0035220D7D